MARRTNETVDLVSEAQYSDTMLNANIRRRLYDLYALPRIGVMNPERPAETNWGIEGEIILALEKFGLGPEDPVAEIGCGDGRLASRLTERRGPTSPIWMFDNKNNLTRGRNLLESNPNAEFVQCDARDLLKADGVNPEMFRAAILPFVLYHIGNYPRALNQAMKALQPEGLLVIATRGTENQKRLWQLAGETTHRIQTMVRAGELALSSFVNVSDKGQPIKFVRGIPASQVTFERPEVYYSHYNATKVDRILSKAGYQPLTTFQQNKNDGRNSHLYIPATAEGMEVYQLALYSIAHRMKSNVSENYIYPSGAFNQVAQEVVRQAFAAEAIGDSLVDEVDQRFSVWRKPPVTSH